MCVCTVLNLDTHTNSSLVPITFSCTLSKPDLSETDRTLAALENEKLLVAGKVTDATGRQSLDGPFEDTVPWQPWETW